MRRETRSVGFALLLLAAALSSAACEVVFLRPLSDPRGAARDGRLEGRWESVEERGSVLRFEAGPPPLFHVSFEKGGDAGRGTLFTAFTSEVGGRPYLHLRPAEGGGEDEGYLVARYEVRGAELVVWVPDADKVRELVAGGGLKGETGRPYGGVLVADDPARVAALLSGPAGEKLWVEVGRFEKLKGK